MTNTIREALEPSQRHIDAANDAKHLLDLKIDLPHLIQAFVKFEKDNFSTLPRISDAGIDAFIDAIPERAIRLAYEHFQHYAKNPGSASALRSAFAQMVRSEHLAPALAALSDHRDGQGEALAPRIADAVAEALASVSFAYTHSTLADMSTVGRSWKVHEAIGGNPFDRNEWLGEFDNKADANALSASLRRERAIKAVASVLSTPIVRDTVDGREAATRNRVERLAMNLRSYAHARGAPETEQDEESALAAARSILTALETMA